MKKKHKTLYITNKLRQIAVSLVALSGMKRLRVNCVIIVLFMVECMFWCQDANNSLDDIHEKIMYV